jgi:type IV secretory pathway VirB10-like protein
MSNTDPPTVPQIQDKRSTPPGILPKNTQAWVLSGLALLMVGVIALSGKNPPKERPAPSPTSGVVDPNAARIQDYQKRIEEQARRLQLEQAEMARTQQALVAPAAPGFPGNHSPGAPESTGLRYGPATTQEDSIQAERRKREYRSLFASNVALTYRRDMLGAAQEPSPTSPTEMLPRPLLSYGYPYSLPALSAASAAQPLASQATAVPAGRTETAGTTPGETTGEAQAAKKAQTNPELQRAEGKAYRLFEGAVIETVLTNRLDGTFSGPVNCMVTANVYSHDGQHVLIPQGSRILGEVRKVQTFGDTRLAVYFHRLITPDGYSVSLDKFQGLNQIGETGLSDLVNHHYLQVFGASLAIGAIAGLSQANTGYGVNESAADAYRQGVTSSLSQSSMHILDRYLNVLPTFTIREGHRVKIYLSNDLLLPAFEKHQMPSDL